MSTFCPLIKEKCRQGECIAWNNDQCVIITFLDLEVKDLSVSQISINNLDDPGVVLKSPSTTNLDSETISHEQLAEELVSLAKQELSFDDMPFGIPSTIAKYFWSTKGIINRWRLSEAIELKIEQAEKLADLMLEKERRQWQKIEKHQEEATDRFNLHFNTEPVSIPQEIIDTTPDGLADELIEFAKNEPAFGDENRIWIGKVAPYFWSKKGLNDRKWDLPSDVQLKIEKTEQIAQQKINSAREIAHKKEIEEEKKELPSLITQCVKWATGYGLKRLTLADVDAFLISKNINIHSENKRSLYAIANVEIKSLKK